MNSYKENNHTLLNTKLRYKVRSKGFCLCCRLSQCLKQLFRASESLGFCPDPLSTLVSAPVLMFLKTSRCSLCENRSVRSCVLSFIFLIQTCEIRRDVFTLKHTHEPCAGVFVCSGVVRILGD